MNNHMNTIYLFCAIEPCNGRISQLDAGFVASSRFHLDHFLDAYQNNQTITWLGKGKVGFPV